MISGTGLSRDSYLMGMFHQNRPVSNYVFFEGQEQCLQSWLGSVVVSWLVVVTKYQPCLIFH